MKINSFPSLSVQYSKRQYTNSSSVNNLTPLKYDIISFSAKRDNDVSVAYAKKLIETYQKPEFVANGQFNIPLDDLLTVCKYCGCVISTGNGKHGKHIETPLGQSHPISIHGGSEPDAGLANDVITAVKNLDENWGEIIFPASTSTVSVDNLKQKAEAHFKSGKTLNSFKSSISCSVADFRSSPVAISNGKSTNNSE